MPTALKEEGFRFYFYSGDKDEPAHVHVAKGDGSGKIWLEPQLKIHSLVGFKKQEILKIMRIAEKHHQELIKKWHAYFKNNK